MKSNVLFGILLGCVFLFQSCTTKPKGRFNYLKIPVPPNYEDARYWAALPDKMDAADLTPAGLKDQQDEAAVDVFFIHPTTYINKAGNKFWNGPTNDQKLNEITDSSTIKYQATIFNGVGRVFAPRYRQAHLESYYTKDQRSAKRAFDMAYADVKVAFDYYLKNYNDGRPVIVAAHSQGTTHGIKLIKEFFDGKSIQDQLVVAYLVGMPVNKNAFRNIPLCETPDQTGCFCSWRTYREKYIPKNHNSNNNIGVTNPLSWLKNEPFAPRDKNKGAILRNFDKIIPEVADAEVYNGLLWVDELRFPGRIFFSRKNLHIADFNLYYMNVRENALERVQAFLKIAETDK